MNFMKIKEIHRLAQAKYESEEPLGGICAVYMCVYVLCICVSPRKSLASVPVFCEEGQNKKLVAMICN